MAKRVAIIIESYNVKDQEVLPGAKCDAEHWLTFLTSNLGGAWRDDEVHVFNKPTSVFIKSLLRQNSDSYIFLAFSGHGFEEYDPYAKHFVTKICLNDQEQDVDINTLTPSLLGTAIFDCCRGVENGQGHIKIANESFSATRQTSLHGTTDAVWQLVKNSIHPRSQTQEKISTLFLQQLDKLKTIDAVRMFSCNSDESAGEDPNAGGYYTTLLIQGAKIWAEAQKGNRNYAVYNTKQAHDFACAALSEIEDRQRPEYMPPWQSYPFAIG